MAGAGFPAQENKSFGRQCPGSSIFIVRSSGRSSAIDWPFDEQSAFDFISCL